MARRVKVASVNQLRADTGLSVEVEGRVIALFQVDGKVCGIDEHCPHAGGPLGAGHLTGDVVMCPWHGWRFRVTDGIWVDAPKAGTKVACYNVTVDGDDIWVEVTW
ncbi:Rieske (2Fe-2S) protein [bacterium]|nr:Rieske (2Fe-2S) protein [bacterium]